MSCAGAGDAGSLGGRPSGTGLHQLHANYRFMSFFLTHFLFRQVRSRVQLIKSLHPLTLAQCFHTVAPPPKFSDEIHKQHRLSQTMLVQQPAGRLS